MSIVFILGIIILAAVLFKMLSQSERTYAYTSTMTITYKADGTEQLSRVDESGIIFIARNTITIDGQPYIFKSSDKRKIQARLNYDGGNLKSINLSLPDGGEKFFYVDRINSVKEVMRH
jgi:hypothetical protein